MQCKSAADFPWAGSHPWDVDIAIVGAGPAGLSAAIRLRWLKTMPPLPLSTCLINSGPLGGLARLGNSTLTSPGLAFPAGELVKRLEGDLKKWPLPMLSGKVIEVKHRKDHFELTLEDGRKLSALAVIMASGMLDIRNMADYWRQGVVATFGNRDNIYTILEKELAGCKTPLVLGGPHLLQLQKTILECNPNATILIPGPTPGEKSNAGAVMTGELHSIKGLNGKLVSATLKTEKGLVERTVDKIILEFNSLELKRGPLPTGVACQKNGFMATLKNCRSEVPGLFAAGDCAGPPFAALIAMGQGAEAAFGAYRFAHEIKYDKKPALFAYLGDDEVTDSLTEKEDFPLRRELIPARLVDSCPLPELQPLWAMINGRSSLAQSASKLGLADDEIFEQIRKLLKERALTFCPCR